MIKANEEYEEGFYIKLSATLFLRHRGIQCSNIQKRNWKNWLDSFSYRKYDATSSIKCHDSSKKTPLSKNLNTGIEILIQIMYIEHIMLQKCI